MFPSNDPEAYADWTAPEHEHTYIDDNTVKAGVRARDGVMYYHLIRRCTQCDEAVTEATNEVVPEIR